MTDPYKGPLSVFTPEELELIRHEIALSSTEELSLKRSILEKVGRAQSSDPRFRIPLGEQPR